jgi:hypothetical protein
MPILDNLASSGKKAASWARRFKASPMDITAPVPVVPSGAGRGVRSGTGVNPVLPGGNPGQRLSLTRHGRAPAVKPPRVYRAGDYTPAMPVGRPLPARPSPSSPRIRARRNNARTKRYAGVDRHIEDNYGGAPDSNRLAALARARAKGHAGMQTSGLRGPGIRPNVLPPTPNGKGVGVNLTKQPPSSRRISTRQKMMLAAGGAAAVGVVASQNRSGPAADGGAHSMYSYRPPVQPM